MIKLINMKNIEFCKPYAQRPDYLEKMPKYLYKFYLERKNGVKPQIIYFTKDLYKVKEL